MSLSTTNKLVAEMSALRGTTQANTSKEEEKVIYKESQGAEKVKQVERKRSLLQPQSHQQMKSMEMS